MKLPVLSYTFLNTYDICPKQAFHRYVLKDHPFVGSEASKWGNVVHDAMDKRLSKGTPLPAECARYEFYAAALEPLKPQTEMKLAIKKDGSACSYWDDDVWCRGKGDTVAIVHVAAGMWDWKTGKKREDPSELELHGLMLKAAYPQLERITGHYVWLQDMTVGKPHDLSNTQETFEQLQEKADEIEMRNKQGIWPTKKSGLCKQHCPVISCGFNGKHK